MHFETRAIHEGQEPDPATGAITTPIYQTSTYVQEAVGVHKGYDYARVGNPTRTALQECLASLEGAAHGRAFSSGLGAATTLMHLLSPGDHVVAVNDVYGGIYRMFTQVYEPKGYRFTFLTPEEISTGLAAHLDERTKFVWLETPTNPALNIVDIAAASEAAHTVGALVVVDNTFATPYLQQPLALGADVALHSTTKYLGGHSDVIGGFVATNDDELAEQLAFLQKSLGAIPGPFDAWLVLRGVKTLAVRMDRHCANAIAVASFLERHPRVESVLYPGLPTHPGHAIAARQMKNFGGMVSFLRRGRAGGRRPRRAHEDLEARGEPRRGRKPHRAPGADDPRVHRGRAVRGAAHTDPAVRRDRVGRGLDRRPRVGARRVTHEPIDLRHQAHGIVACYLLATEDGPALVDCGPTTCIPALKAGLHERGLELADVRHLLLSHIHLDHAGAAGVLVREHPDLQVHVSEVGAPHMVDPSKLDASARRLYGDAFDELWGELAPIPTENVHVVGDSVVGLECFPTPGHAWHHVSFLDRDRTLYAGDAAGVRLAGGRFVMPPCPPPELDLEAWERTIAEIERRAPARLALIHFGVFDDVEEHLDSLRETLRRWGERVEDGMDEATFIAAARYDMERTDPDLVDEYQRAGPYWHHFRGIERYWRKRREAAAALD